MARDDDYERRDRPASGGLNGFFGNTNTVILILFGFCCGLISLVVGIIGLATCTDPKAKQNAMIVTIISGIMCAISVVLQLTGALSGVGGGPK